MNAADVMTTHVVTVSPDTSVREVARLLHINRMSAVPVVDEAGRVLGMLSKADLNHWRRTGGDGDGSRRLSSFANGGTTPADPGTAGKAKARDIMVRDVFRAGKDASHAKTGAVLERAYSRGGEGTVRIGITTVIPELLQSLGADPTEVLAELGLDPQLFADPSNVMSLAARGRLFSHCVARTGCKHFGLLIGQTGHLSSLGLLGFLVQHSPDVETALRSFVRFSHLVVRGAGTNLAMHGDFATLSYEVHQPGVEATEQAGDGAMAMFFNVMRKLCGPEWKPVEVWFTHRKPEDVGPYRRFFEAPLCFDAEQYAIVFSAAWLSHRLPDDDPELRRHLREQIDAIEARHQEDFPAQVRSVLRTALISGHAKADQVAALFSMHSRTLHRRLRGFGTNFHTLVDELRFEIARQMLENSGMELRQIAAMLDYADASAFTRAFKRWSGAAPGVWRAKQERAS